MRGDGGRLFDGELCEGAVDGRGCVGGSFIAFMAMLGPASSCSDMQFLAGRAAAAGIAAMNTITMFAGFVGPYWMGVMKDYTGSYDRGIEGAGVAVPAGGGNDVPADAKPCAAVRGS